jgi:3-hydroxy acid dehydrogenase/malonic semialdehyde reductase
MMVVFVTGATAGFGEAIAERFIADGHHVVAAARRADKLDALRARLGERLHPLVLDVCDAEAVAALPRTLPAPFADVTVLVNNAGLALGMEPAQRASLDDWQRMIDTNVTGLIHVTHALLPGMVQRNAGHVINIGSVAGTYPYAGGNVYGASKAFVRQFSLNLRADLIGTALRVTNIEPGMVGGTEFSTVRFKGDAAKAASRYEGVTCLTAADIAEAVAWVSGLPAHVNINTLEVMPVSQSFSPLSITRDAR